MLLRCQWRCEIHLVVLVGGVQVDLAYLEREGLGVLPRCRLGLVEHREVAP